MPARSTASGDWCVLVAAESADDRRLVEGLLRLVPGADVRVIHASLSEALSILAGEDPLDAMVVVVDYLRDDTFDFLRRCIRHGRAPLIVVSGQDDVREAVRTLREGAGGFLVKAHLSGALLHHALRDAIDHWDAGLGIVRPRALPEPGSGHGRPASGAPESVPEPPAPPAREPPEQSVPEPEEKKEKEQAQERSQAEQHPPQRRRVPTAVTYSTAGIDAAMKQFGLERPRLLSDVLQEARRETERLLNAIRDDPDPLHYAMLVTVVSLLQEHVQDIRDLNAALAYHYGPEDYFGGSAVDAALMVHLLCNADDMTAEDHAQLMVAALLHEVGYVVTKTAPSAAPASLAQHCEEGARVARMLGAPSFVPDAIRQHEEHVDGSGVPAGLSGDQIAREAQFILLGVVYSDLFAGRVTRTGEGGNALYRGKRLTARDPHTAILRDLRAWFRPDILRLFIMQAGFYAVGTLVELTNRAIARVISPNPGRPNAPVVEIVNRADGSRPEQMTLLDLSRNPALGVARVLSYEHVLTPVILP